LKGYCSSWSSLTGAGKGYPIFCYSDSACTTGTSPECIVDSTCGTCSVCDSSTLTCKTSGECILDTDCASDEYCDNCLCVDYECVIDSDCSLGYYCLSNNTCALKCGDSICSSSESHSSCPADCLLGDTNSTTTDKDVKDIEPVVKVTPADSNLVVFSEEESNVPVEIVTVSSMFILVILMVVLF